MNWEKLFVLYNFLFVGSRAYIYTIYMSSIIYCSQFSLKVAETCVSVVYYLMLIITDMKIIKFLNDMFRAISWQKRFLCLHGVNTS